MVEAINDMENKNIGAPEMKENLFKAKVLGVNVKKSLSWLASNDTFSTQEEPYAAADKEITCSNCHITMLYPSVIQSWLLSSS